MIFAHDGQASLLLNVVIPGFRMEQHVYPGGLPRQCQTFTCTASASQLQRRHFPGTG